MARVAIYGLLFLAIILTAYFLVIQSPDEPAAPLPATSREEVTREVPVAENSSSVESPEPPPELSGPSYQLAPAAVGEESGAKKQGEGELASKAAERFHSGDYKGAIRLYRELSEYDRSGFAGIGISYFKLGDLENARTFLEKAVEHNPNDFEVRKCLAFIYSGKDDLEKGLAHAEAGLSLRKDPELRRLYEKLARDKSTQDSSLSESSEHFRITFDGYKHGAMSRKVIEILEDAYSAVGKEFDYFPSEPVNAVLYTNRDFYDVTRAPGWSGGVFDGKIRIPVRGAETNEPLLKQVLFHEYTHSVVRSLTARCPLWINEGLAEYFSRNYQKKIGQFIPLKSLGSSFSWLSGKDAGLAYWESYSAVSYLVERYGFYRMKEFLQSLSASADLEEAFKGSFGITYSEFVSSWGKG